jgi:DNA-binding NtrC family response regulator
MSKPTTILIIDDDASIRRLCLRVLQKLNFHYLEAESGGEGYEIFTENAGEVAAILLDLNLPDGSGIDWAEKLQRFNATIPVIFFTGANQIESMNSDHSHRFYLKKPFTPATMSDVLEKATRQACA